MSDKNKLLIVDDEPNFLNSIKLYMEMEGYKVDTAPDAQTALKLSEENDYDLIVSDVLMPGMDGFELRKKMRSLEKTKKTPIILLTAKEITTENIVELNDNITGFVMKPFDHPMLIKVISELINRNA